MILTIIEFGKTKMVGELTDTGIFKKYVKKSKHLFYSLNAWGIDLEIFNSVLKEKALLGIFIYDQENHQWYKTNIEQFQLNGIIKESISGYNPQIFLPLKYWEIKENKNQLQLL